MRKYNKTQDYKSLVQYVAEELQYAKDWEFEVLDACDDYRMSWCDTPLYERCMYSVGEWCEYNDVDADSVEDVEDCELLFNESIALNSQRKEIDAVKQLIDRVRGIDLQDAVEEMVDNLISREIGLLEKEIGYLSDDDTRCWYDDAKEKLREEILNKIADWCSSQATKISNN